jgi:hypothetical protein
MSLFFGPENNICYYGHKNTGRTDTNMLTVVVLELEGRRNFCIFYTFLLFYCFSTLTILLM